MTLGLTCLNNWNHRSLIKIGSSQNQHSTEKRKKSKNSTLNTQNINFPKKKEWKNVGKVDFYIFF